MCDIQTPSPEPRSGDSTLPDTSQPAVLLVGDVDSPSFQDVRRHIAGGDERSVATTSDALTLLDSEPWSPDVIIVWQGVPDEFPR